MPLPGDLIFSAIFLSIIIGGFTFSFQNFLWFFGSIGMLLIWYAWVIWLDIDNNWPLEQPRIEYYTPTKEEKTRLYTILGDNYTDQELKDFHRCMDYNVCVRKFKK